jgi:hypothetical protein
MASVFWDARGIIYIEGQTTNSEYDIALLERSKRRNQEKTAPFEEKKCCLIKINKNDCKIA